VESRQKKQRTLPVLNEGDLPCKQLKQQSSFCHFPTPKLEVADQRVPQGEQTSRRRQKKFKVQKNVSFKES